MNQEPMEMIQLTNICKGVANMCYYKLLDMPELFRWSLSRMCFLTLPEADSKCRYLTNENDELMNLKHWITYSRFAVNVSHISHHSQCPVESHLYLRICFDFVCTLLTLLASGVNPAWHVTFCSTYYFN